MWTGTRRTAFTRATVGLLALGGMLTACGSHSTKAATRPAGTVTTNTVNPTTSSSPPAPTTCPLTGQPAPGGKVPQRPALAIKVENLPEARPQYGFSKADVIYEEPVEGGITRFIAIYQCHGASRVEPVRSGRLIDPQIIRQYGAHPLLAYAGAIQPAVAAIDSSPLVDLSFLRAVNEFWRDPNRVAPHNLETSTSGLYAYAASHGAPQTPPPSPFTFGSPILGGTPAGSVHISYEYSNLTWTWNPTTGLYQRSYDDVGDVGPAMMGEGGQMTASNVIVMYVVEYPSPYVEDPTGSHENLLTLTGTGAVHVFRNGAEFSGTWVRPSLSDVTRYVSASGQTITLNPGQTWIELVPTTVPMAVTP
jgi:hypothetical protein